MEYEKLTDYRPPSGSTRNMPTHREIDEYVTSLVPPRPDECHRMEQIAREERFPIIGPACGHFCYMIAKMIDAWRVFELGSGFGYSTYWFARAIKENGGGEVHHTVWDNELSARARDHLTKLELADLVVFHTGEAVETLRGIDAEFDLMFCDIDKHAYPEALVEMNRHLRPGGVVIFDNMLLHGSVLPSHYAGAPPLSQALELLQHKKRHDENRRGVTETTKMLFDEAAWIASLIPLRDGIAVAMKK